MTIQASFQRFKGDGHHWYFHKPLDAYVRLAKRGEGYCGVSIKARTLCHEPAAVIAETGDLYCAKHFGNKATDKLRELERDSQS